MSLIQSALYLAWSDAKARYKKSVLGPFWPTLTNLLGIVGLSLVWAELMNQDMQTFVPQLTISLIMWQLISGVLVEGPIVFVRQAPMIRNVAIPSWFFAFRALARHLINLFHNALIVLGVFIYSDVPITFGTWMFVPGLVLVILNLYWLLLLLGLLGARFRDIEYLIASLVPLLFFISPVLYRVDRLPEGMNLVWLNPVSYMIEAIRAPLLGQAISGLVYSVLIAMLLIGGALTWSYQRTYGKNLAFWV
ncbi:ABC transporter permease [Flavobacterium sp.]|jgi:ABC-type polysaccharide/polyol phosphate export permease|uniref:ABC transporter permease n=1 Tax=Flavobacterium sp. TaxID=239 RepID=UPI0037C17A88